MTLLVALIYVPWGFITAHMALLCVCMYGEVEGGLARSIKGQKRKTSKKRKTDVSVLCLLISWVTAVIAGLPLTSWWAHHAHQIIPHTLAPVYTSSFIALFPHFICQHYS